MSRLTELERFWSVLSRVNDFNVRKKKIKMIYSVAKNFLNGLLRPQNGFCWYVPYRILLKKNFFLNWIKKTDLLILINVLHFSCIPINFLRIFWWFRTLVFIFLASLYYTFLNLFSRFLTNFMHFLLVFVNFLSKVRCIFFNDF